MIYQSQHENIAEQSWSDIITLIKSYVFDDGDSVLYAPYYVEVQANLEELKQRFILQNLSKQFCCYPFSEWRFYVTQAFAALSDKYVPLFKKLNDEFDLFGYGDDGTITTYKGTLSRDGTNTDTFNKNYTNGKQHSHNETDTSYDNSQGGTIRENRNIFYQTPQDDLSSSIAYNEQGNPVIQNGGNLSRNYATNMTKDVNQEIHNEKQHVVGDITNDEVTNKEGGTVSHGIDNKDTHDFTTDVTYKGNHGEMYYKRYNEYIEEFTGLYNAFLNEQMIKDLFSVFIQ